MTMELQMLAEIELRISELSASQHELARKQKILIRAATQLRLGRSAALVIAEIREHSADLLSERYELHLTRKLPPLTLVANGRREAAPAGAMSASVVAAE